MSVLAWLFGLGALAIALPLLFHLIRRTPKGQQEFSSLMFLKPSPPTLTRRSRLDNLLLLLLRALALGLIAFAFMRPFFRSTEMESYTNIANRRLAILVDSSASMKRADLWKQAQDQIDELLKDLETGDDVAFYSFDGSLTEHVPFDELSQLEPQNIAASLESKKDLIGKQAEELQPGWQRGDLGSAMTVVTDQMVAWRDAQANKAAVRPKLQMAVVSDLQYGSKTDSLQSYQWPTDVFVEFKPVVAKESSNATIELLNPVEDEPDTMRVRIANGADSEKQQFFVHWDSSEPKTDEPGLEFYVPPGTSQVQKVAAERMLGTNRLFFTGDTEDFDNSYFAAPTVQQQLTVGYIGKDNPDNPDGLLYYLQRSFVNTPDRAISVRQIEPGGKIELGEDRPTLLVIADAIPSEMSEQATQFLEQGGTALVVLTDDETTAAMKELCGIENHADADPGNEETQTRSRGKRNYAMLAEIEFEHPFFAPFANPRYNDFTKVRFWDSRDVQLQENESLKVLGRLDNERPLVWQRKIENPKNAGRPGEVYVLASGWQPSESQLALSSKFLPMMNNLVEISTRRVDVDQSLLVGQTIQLPSFEGIQQSVKRVLTLPDGTRIDLDSDDSVYTATNAPGVYTVSAETTRNEIPDEDQQDAPSKSKPELPKTRTLETQSFAVNVDRAESNSAVLPIEQLETLGVVIGQQETASEEVTRLRELRDRELEGSQKVWKWLIVGAIVLLIAETWLAGRTASKSNSPRAAEATALAGEATS